jgi:REP element-mobilizing transposase RayT
VQGELKFGGRGGFRPGSGRKPKGDRAGVSHRQRAALASRFPVHVTLKMREGLKSLRGKAERRVLFEAFAKGCERDGFRMVQFSVQKDHVHLVAEAKGRTALARGVQGLCIRVARALNRLWGRKGKVFGDRYHDRILRTPREVKNVLRYVLQNGKRHGMGLLGAVDLMSSAPWFDGWREKLIVTGLEGIARPVAEARTWLIQFGWRRHGLLAFSEVPGPPPRMPPRKGG